MVRTTVYAAGLLAALSLFFPLNRSLAAQSAIVATGTVRDVSGAPVPGSTVDVIVDGRALGSATTADDGRYRVSIPAAVSFELRVRRAGFAEALIRLPGKTTDAARDVTLQVGDLSDRVVVTASRGADARAAVTASVSVMTRQDLEAIDAASLADALRFVPGVSVEASGREGAVTSVFARGGESDYNLVLIDGVRVNASGGQFDFSRISAGEIDRIEVVRGAQSALWGSDAMGAVVQIFTRQGAGAGRPHVSGSVEGGTFDTWRGDLRVAGGSSLFDYQAGVAHRRTDGAFADLLPQDDWFEQSAFDGGIGFRLGNRASVRSALRVSRAQGRGVGNITFGSRDTGGQYDTTDLSWHAEVPHSIGRRFAGTASVNYFRSTSLADDTVADAPFSTYAVLSGTPDAIFPRGTRLVRLVDQEEFDALAAAGGTPAPGQFLGSATSFDFPFSNRTQFRRPGVRYQGDLLWAGGQRLSAGYEWERETNPLVAAYTLDNNAVFVQQETTIADRWFVTAGVRVDDRESYDTFVSPKLSAGGFLLAPRAAGVSSVKVTGNIGKGIKSPTFNERFGDAFADPSPGLKVERARTADIGVDATFARERIRAGATYFNNVYRDQVAYRFGPVGDGIPDYINIDGSRAQGWELEGELQRAVYGIRFGGSYSFVDSKVVTALSTSQQFQPGQPLLRRPKHSGTLRASYDVWRATILGDLLFVGDRHDNSFLFLETVPNASMPAPVFTDITVNPGYTVAGIGADVRLDRGVTAFIRARNIADTSYDAALGYPGTPRTVTAGVRFAFDR
jgi:outer membrane cobalamin receptor